MSNGKGQSKAEMSRLMKQIWLRQFFFAVLVMAAGVFLVKGTQPLPLLAGLFWATADNALVLGAPIFTFDDPPDNIKKSIFKLFILRVALALGVTALMLSLKLRLVETLLGFLLLHIFFIINLKIFTGAGNNTQTDLAVRKGENKDGN